MKLESRKTSKFLSFILSLPQFPIGAFLVSRVQEDSSIKQCAMNIGYHTEEPNVNISICNFFMTEV